MRACAYSVVCKGEYVYLVYTLQKLTGIYIYTKRLLKYFSLTPICECALSVIYMHVPARAHTQTHHMFLYTYVRAHAHTPTRWKITMGHNNTSLRIRNQE